MVSVELVLSLRMPLISAEPWTFSDHLDRIRILVHHPTLTTIGLSISLVDNIMPPITGSTASRHEMTTIRTNLTVVLAALLAVILVVASSQVSSAQSNILDERIATVKTSGFVDPNTNHLYKVVSYNVTQMAANSNIRSLIKVWKVKIRDIADRTPMGDPEYVQTLKFIPSLVDFDLDCVPTHCYLVAVTSKSRLNVLLYAWQRTHFDIQSTRDSFSRASAVKLFRIQSSFYIAIAQEQLHLSPYKLSQEYDGTVRFIGCAILKFVKGNERNVKYHQFIRLPFNPMYVHYFTSTNAVNVTGLNARPIENHHLVFSVSPNWNDTGTNQARSYIWSPLDDYFWPYRMPQGAETLPRTGPSGGHLVRFPINLPESQSYKGPPRDYVEPIESCFHQLERLLADRDIQARQLLDSSKSIWRSDQASAVNQFAAHQLTNISAQVIVHGNVTVHGSLIESPQISLIAGRSSPIIKLPSVREVSELINSHSPAIVENRLKQARYKLNYIRQKLSRAVLANLDPNGTSILNNQVRFFGTVEAKEIIFSGIENSNVRLNGIPFRQLEHELVSLNGIQDIQTKVVFDGSVVADVLEIHGQINDYLFLKDAIDITSRHIQIIDVGEHNYVPNMPGPLTAVVFQSISAPEIMMAPNATINSIRLDDFITRDNRSQLVLGRKSFKRLSMGKLNLANQDVLLNDINIHRLAGNAVHLRSVDGKPFQSISGRPVNFMRGVHAKQLILNNMINKHINLTSLIYDSVKSNEAGLQQIYGQKNFLSKLRINRLSMEGSLNGIEVGQIFNLNPAPPVPDYQRFTNNATSFPQIDVTGEFMFQAPVTVRANVNSQLVNGIDLSRRAIRRFPIGQSRTNSSPQIVHGHKLFYKPVRVLNSARLLDLRQASMFVANNTRIPYPLINNIDLRLITDGLLRQKQQPSLIYVENLEIDGNLNLPSSTKRNDSPRITLGNYSFCPVDLIHKRLVLASGEEQVVEVPLRVNSLRARTISTETGKLNGLRFPQDFVLRTANRNQQLVELVSGNKSFDHIIISPSNLAARYEFSTSSKNSGIVLGQGVSINQVNYGALQTFIMHEKQHNSTGEKVFSTMNVYGNLGANRINGNRWPDDILLKSISLTRGLNSSPYHHKRIYSHLIFMNSGGLEIRNQLVLRGPIQLNGRMNGVNLTEFARQSATYGDKDLYSIGRPIRNKIFAGGLTVKGEIRSQGLINGVNFDEMRQRVVTVGPSREPRVISSPKMFMSDATFQSPIDIKYLSDIPVNQYLERIQFQTDGGTLKVRGKKTVTGALRINRNLIVRGLINGVDFAELQARAISLAPTDELAFNKTLTVEGDVFMDNLWIDERNGTIDGVKLTNLLPVGAIGKNELILQSPHLDRRADPFDRVLTVSGTFLDCQISCNLQRPLQLPSQPPIGNQSYPPPAVYPSQPVRPIIYPAQSVLAYTSRPALVANQRNFTVTHTTPPYSLTSIYQPPISYPTTPIPSPTPTSYHRGQLPPSRQRQMSSLIQRMPVAVNYEQRVTPLRPIMVSDKTAIISDNIENLRQHIVSMNMIRLSAFSDAIVGFIEAPTNDISGLHLGDDDRSYSGHNINIKSYILLDQIDYTYVPPTVYHLSAGVFTDQFGQNTTSVYSSLGDSNSYELSKLPVELPNSAMFLKVPPYNSLFLIISQDYSINTAMCATADIISNQLFDTNQPQSYHAPTRRTESGIHVYVFSALQNSSSLFSSYFDLYQTIDLPGIDGFEHFLHHGSTYVLAISRSVGRVYLLLLRGYSGFQVVSHMDTPAVERVTVMFTHDDKPMLLIQQTSGQHRLMESVMI